MPLVQTFLQNLYEILLPQAHLHHHHHYLRDYFIIFTHCNFRLFLYYADQYNFRIIILIKIATTYYSHYIECLKSN